MAYGNNIESFQIRRINFPLFDQEGNTNNGQKFYFPEHPEIDNKTIVGIEAHLRTAPLISQGDLESNYIGGGNLDTGFAAYVYFCFYNTDNEEVFYNVPMKSIFGKNTIVGTSPKQKIKPYFGKIKTRNCYAYVPANTPITISGNYFINLTFYLR